MGTEKLFDKDDFQDEDIDLGSRLTFLTDSEAKNFLNKYDKIIIIESKRRTPLCGISAEDLAQECRMKLLSGLHLYDNNKSSEKTWAVSVIKKALNTIWSKALKKKRVCTIPDKYGEEAPVRDLDIETDNFYNPKRGKYSATPIKDSYYESPDNRPAFGTISFPPEEYLRVLQALEFLKTHLPEESYEYIRKELIPQMDGYIKTNEKIELEKPIRPKEEYSVWSIFSGLEENEIHILAQIADFFVNVLGFDKEEILGRTKTIDVQIK